MKVPAPNAVASDLYSIAGVLADVLAEYATAHGYVYGLAGLGEGSSRRLPRDIKPTEEAALQEWRAERAKRLREAADKITWVDKELRNALVILERVSDPALHRVRQPPYDKHEAVIRQAAFAEAVAARQRRRDRIEAIGEG